MRTYSFVSQFREKHFYQTAVYDRSAPPRTIVHAVRMSPSQRDGMHYISEMGILRHSALVICKYAPTVPVMDIRHCRLHKLLSAVHDLYKFSSIMTERTLNDEKTMRMHEKTDWQIPSPSDPSACPSTESYYKQAVQTPPQGLSSEAFAIIHS